MKYKTALLIEDDDEIRDSLSTVLGHENFIVFTAKDGQEGIEVLERIPRPDVILLDIMMPRMNGWQFLDRQRSDKRFADIPVIVVSAFPNIAKSIKSQAYLVKPVNLESLICEIEKNVA